MSRYHVVAAAVSLSALAGCHYVESSSRTVDGCAPTARATGCETPIEVLSGRPSRPFRVLGTVDVKIDRGTALRNPKLADAIPTLSARARDMGADAVMLVQQQYASWYDLGEDARPIHDLESQETWYITEKARYVTGVAIAWTGCAPAPVLNGTVVPMAPSTTVVPPPVSVPPAVAPPLEPAPMTPPPAPEPAPVPAPEPAPAPGMQDVPEPTSPPEGTKAPELPK